MKTILLSMVLFLNYYCYCQCPPEGKGRDDAEKALNVKKNRSAAVPHRSAQDISLNTIIVTKPKPDRNKFAEGAYVSVTGFIVDRGEQGAETCNCGLADKSKKTGDVHINLGLVADAAKKNTMIVEITPAFKKLHPEYASLIAKGSKVKVFGYLVYDYLHEGESLSTCTKCGNAWRKTCWEIHPIVKIDAQ